MKHKCAVLFLCSAFVWSKALAIAQNPDSTCFPTCTEQDMGVAENGVKTELSAPVGISDTTITVADASRILINQPCFAIDGTGELMRVTGKPGGNDITVERGIDRTGAATHSTGTEFRCANAAFMYNVKAANWLAVQTEILLCATTSELTISGGNIVVPYSGCFSVDTEADAASDDLTSITCAAGVHMKLFPESDARTVVVRETPGAVEMQQDADFTMDNAFDMWEAWCRTANVAREENRTNGGA